MWRRVFWGIPRSKLGSLRFASTQRRKAFSSDLIPRLSAVWYCTVFGACMLFVPFYKIYCSNDVGVQERTKGSKYVRDTYLPVEQRRDMVRVHFNARNDRSIPLQFAPLQTYLDVLVGEPALAFFRVYNNSDEEVHAVSTYNIIPQEAMWYFHKLQCFCFEEQRVLPREFVELPIFFYVDPEFSNDNTMAKITDLILSYTFFYADEEIRSKSWLQRMYSQITRPANHPANAQKPV
eukprot:TRINITY_DN3092_c0_g1_i1.p1 TRINITY_DN3092_c0_g1~~TRINITY_DN3092_c0_g1_i1.p1  ORF type:complete len:235 (+),score=30.86 TRINITY_DN3092_c0_g1_i1:26-730(+)